MLNSNFEQHARKVLEKWGYTQIRKIGKGGFGHVVLVSKFFISMNFYAVKCFSLKNNTKDANLKSYIQQEVKIMENIDHPNVVRFETAFQDSGWYFIVMEYCDMGNLLTYQSKLANKTLGLAKASKLLLQILNGILTIHSQNIIHRDIKCQNIFLKKNLKGNGYQCKIGDFGFAKQIDQYTKTSCGTTNFMAPQVLRKMPYSFQADIWSIGVVFYFMIFGDFPFKGLNIQKQIYDKCVNGFSLSESVPAYKQKKQFALLQDFFRKVFDLDQDRRIKLEDMIQHKIFRSGEAMITQDQMSDQVLDQNIEWSLGKLRFIQDLIVDLTSLKILEPYLLHSTRFYLYKISASILKEEIIQQYPRSNSKIGKQLDKKEKIFIMNIQKQYESLSKYGNEVKKINNFNQGYNLVIQDFYAMKEGYRNTLSLVYSDVQKKIQNQSLKIQMKLRVLCCHLINRVFGKSIKSQTFPNFNFWAKCALKGTQLKRQSQFQRLKQWIQHQSPEKLANQIQNINKKFYC